MTQQALRELVEAIGPHSTLTNASHDEVIKIAKAAYWPLKALLGEQREAQGVDKRAEPQYSMLERRLEIAEHKVLVAIPGTEGVLNIQLQDAANEVGKALNMVRLLSAPPLAESVGNVHEVEHNDELMGELFNITRSADSLDSIWLGNVRSAINAYLRRQRK